jgi:hypothetical protein
LVSEEETIISQICKIREWQDSKPRWLDTSSSAACQGAGAVDREARDAATRRLRCPKGYQRPLVRRDLDILDAITDLLDAVSSLPGATDVKFAQRGADALCARIQTRH